MIYSLLISLSLFAASGEPKKPVLHKSPFTLNFQDARAGNMSVIEFKNQLFCRAEMPQDFEFDVHFSVVSVNAYFTGTNFRGVEKRSLKGNSLKQMKDLMDKCAAGSVVTFDEVKVLGPDKEIRSIPGVTYRLF